MTIAGVYEQLAREQRWDEALPLIEQFVRLNPQSATAWFNLGVCLSELRRSRDASAAFETAYELDPDDHNAQYRMFRNLYFSGDFEQFLAKLRDECESNRAALNPFLHDELYSELFHDSPFKEFREELEA